MADKDTGKDDGYEFSPPDFDEDQFIHRELVSFRTTLILFVWGIAAALVSWAAFAGLRGALVGWYAGLLVCIAGFFALRPLFARFGADIRHWKRREWLGTGFLYFFTWLAFFILVINPPISDYAPPRVDVHAGPVVQQAGGAVVIDLFVEDNTRVASHDFRLSHDGQGLATESALHDLGGGHYQYSALLPAGAYDLEASASDPAGHHASATGNFSVVADAIAVYPPANATIDDPTDQVLVQVNVPTLPTCTLSKGVVTNSPCIRSVHLDRDDGGQVLLEWSKSDNGWRATSNFAGWAQGPNNVTAVADVIGQLEGTTLIPGGSITAAPVTVNVAIATGSLVPSVIPEPVAGARRVPGLEAPLLAMGLVAMVALLRRRA